MKRLLCTAAFGFAALLFTAPVMADAHGDGCFRKKFETKLVKDACEKGAFGKTGQKAAKKAMQKWLKSIKDAKKAGKDATAIKDIKLTCDGCHDTLKNDYKLKADGLKNFKALQAWLDAK